LTTLILCFSIGSPSTAANASRLPRPADQKQVATAFASFCGLTNVW